MLIKCIDNNRYPASLELGKIYEAREIPDDPWLEEYFYVTDESGEEYIYPRNMFEVVEE